MPDNLPEDPEDSDKRGLNLVAFGGQAQQKVAYADEPARGKIGRAHV